MPPRESSVRKKYMKQPLHFGWFVVAVLFLLGSVFFMAGVDWTQQAHQDGWDKGWAARDAAYTEEMVRWNLQADSACVAWYPTAVGSEKIKKPVHTLTP